MTAVGAWIEEVDIACPASPMTAESLGALESLERLHCFGRDEIVLTGTVSTPCCGYVGAFVYSPAWLGPIIPAFIVSAGGGIAFHAYPDANLVAPARGDVVRVTGHYEDAAATTCRATVDPSFAAMNKAPELRDPALVVLNCRSTFVWTDYEVIGHENLGPCCGGQPRVSAHAWLPAWVEIERRPVAA